MEAELAFMVSCFWLNTHFDRERNTMADNPYERFDTSKLILRDELAIDRTMLSNERTLLAYSRTALTLIIVGLTFFHFIETGFLRMIGIVFVPAGIFLGLYGGFRFIWMKRMIRCARTKTTEGQKQ